MWSKRKMEMGWSEGVGCKKHRAQNKQLEGVCPFCLRERLTQLAADSQSQLLDSFSPDSSHSSSPAGCISFASSSNNTSPAHARGRHTRNVSEGMGSIAFMFGSHGLKKSRSVAFGGELNKNAKKKEGFWRKLFHRERFREAYA